MLQRKRKRSLRRSIPRIIIILKKAKKGVEKSAPFFMCFIKNPHHQVHEVINSLIFWVMGWA